MNGSLGDLYLFIQIQRREWDSCWAWIMAIFSHLVSSETYFCSLFQMSFCALENIRTPSCISCRKNAVALPFFQSQLKCKAEIIQCGRIIDQAVVQMYHWTVLSPFYAIINYRNAMFTSFINQANLVFIAESGRWGNSGVGG